MRDIHVRTRDRAPRACVRARMKMRCCIFKKDIVIFKEFKAPRQVEPQIFHVDRGAKHMKHMNLGPGAHHISSFTRPTGHENENDFDENKGNRLQNMKLKLQNEFKVSIRLPTKMSN